MFGMSALDINSVILLPLIMNSPCRPGREWFALHRSHYGRWKRGLYWEGRADIRRWRRRHPVRGSQTKAKDDHHGGDILKCVSGSSGVFFYHTMIWKDYAYIPPLSLSRPVCVWEVGVPLYCSLSWNRNKQARTSFLHFGLARLDSQGGFGLMSGF